jgi:integrase
VPSSLDIETGRSTKTRHSTYGALDFRKADRPKVDPFAMHDAERFIAAVHRDWGEAQGNYDEFRFFTGLRPSEQIALVLSDIDLVHGFISVSVRCRPG